jgi:hypothetical protein
VGYFLSFGLLYLGYCLVDWGHYVVKHEPVNLWWLMSGLGTRDGTASSFNGGVGPPGIDPNALIPGTDSKARVIPPAGTVGQGYTKGRNI